jgi:hypothetical protein
MGHKVHYSLYSDIPLFQNNLLHGQILLVVDLNVAEVSSSNFVISN